MRCVLRRQVLAGLLLGMAGWAAPAVAQVGPPTAAAVAAPPAPEALASAGRFVALCESKLQLAPEQATSLRTYLDQEVNYLSVLALNGIEPVAPEHVATEAQQLDQVMGRLLSPTQQRQYQQLVATAPAQQYLRSMALLAPSAEASTAKTKHRKGSMLAQRLDGEE